MRLLVKHRYIHRNPGYYYYSKLLIAKTYVLFYDASSDTEDKFVASGARGALKRLACLAGTDQWSVPLGGAKTLVATSGLLTVLHQLSGLGLK